MVAGLIFDPNLLFVRVFSTPQFFSKFVVFITFSVYFLVSTNLGTILHKEVYEKFVIFTVRADCPQSSMEPEDKARRSGNSVCKTIYTFW